MGLRSRNKGKAGEREAAAEIRRLFGVEAHRGRQYSGSDESPDIVTAIPDLHFEVKRAEAFRLYPALEQATNDADVRVTPPRDQRGDTGRGTGADAARDERLPTDTIERTYKGRLIRVIVRGSSFEYDGRRYKSLSAVAKAISGSHCNGFRFFGLEGKR